MIVYSYDGILTFIEPQSRIGLLTYRYVSPDWDLFLLTLVEFVGEIIHLFKFRKRKLSFEVEISEVVKPFEHSLKGCAHDNNPTHAHVRLCKVGICVLFSRIQRHHVEEGHYRHKTILFTRIIVNLMALSKSRLCTQDVYCNDHTESQVS